MQHIELAGLRPAIEVAYTKIVTITTDDADEIGEMKRATGAYWPFLSDPSARCSATWTSRSTPTRAMTR